MYSIKNILIAEEGRRLKVYKDTKGILTVGIGHNLISDPVIDILGRRLKLDDMITVAECEKLFQKDLDRVNNNLPKWFTKLKDKYQLVVLNMIFQMGLTRTLDFYSQKGEPYTINLMLKDDLVEVISHIKKSKWYSDTPNRCDRLIRLLKGEVVKEYE
jgi:lysozyme